MVDLIKPFYVIVWDFNNKAIEYYDIMNVLIREYEKRYNDKYLTMEECIEFIDRFSKAHWMHRCEYEVLIAQWPPKAGLEEKIDIYSQIKANISIIADLLMGNIELLYMYKL